MQSEEGRLIYNDRDQVDEKKHTRLMRAFSHESVRAGPGGQSAIKVKIRKRLGII